MITNRGNVAINESVEIEVFATTNGTIDGNAVEVGQLVTTLKLNSDQARKALKVPLTVASGLDGDYTLVTRVTPTGEDTDPNNNTAETGALSVAEIVPGLGAEWGLDFKFTVTSDTSVRNFVLHQEGTFVDDRGRAGTFALHWVITTESGFFTLDYNDDEDAPAGQPWGFVSTKMNSIHNKTLRFVPVGLLPAAAVMGTIPGTNPDTVFGLKPA